MRTEIKFYFKKTLFGQVLMVEDRKPTESPGMWYYFFRKATTAEASQFTTEVELIKEKIPLIRKLKDEHPSIFI